MRLRLIFCLALFLSLSACARIQAPVVTEVSQRPVESPSKPPSTATLTDFPPPTKTATQTRTPNPTDTPTPLPSPTPTVKPHELAITVDNFQSITLLKEFGRSYPIQILWTSDSNAFLVASLGKVSLMDAVTFEVIKTFEISQAITPFTGTGNLAVSPDGKRLFTTRTSVEAWDMSTGQLLGSWGYIAGGIRSFAISADGRVVAIAGPARGGGGDPDYTMEIIDIVRGRKIYSVQQYGIIGSIAVNQDGSLIASSSERGLEIFDGRTGELLHLIHNRIGHVTFGSDGIMAEGSEMANQSARLWDAGGGQILSVLENGFGHPVFSSDGLWLALWTRSGTIQIWETTAYQRIQTIENTVGEIYSVAFSSEGKTLAAINQDDKSRSIVFWNIESGQTTQALTGFTPPIESVAFSPDSNLLLAWTDQSTSYIWDIESGTPYSTPTTYTHSRNTSPLSPNGQVQALEWIDQSTYPFTGVIRLINKATGKVIHELKGHEVISGEGFTGMVESMVFNWDGSLLASAGYDGTAKLWDVSMGQLLMTLASPVSVTDINFSPDGRYLATSSWDGTIRLWGILNP